MPPGVSSAVSGLKRSYKLRPQRKVALSRTCEGGDALKGVGAGWRSSCIQQTGCLLFYWFDWAVWVRGCWQCCSGTLYFLRCKTKGKITRCLYCSRDCIFKGQTSQCKCHNISCHQKWLLICSVHYTLCFLLIAHTVIQYEKYSKSTV